MTANDRPFSLSSVDTDCIVVRMCGHADVRRLDAAVALFRSLSDENRLAIVRRLVAGEARVADLVEQLGLAQSTVSAHVACLRDCGLVEGRPEGRQIFYSLARPELLDLLRSAEDLLRATGSVVAICPTYGTEAPGERGRAGGQGAEVLP